MIIDTLLPERPARISLSHMNRTSDDRQGVASGGRRGGQSARHLRLMPYLGAAAVTAVALALALLIDAYLFVANVVLVFLGGVVLCAIRWGMRPALFACLLSVLALNFFLFPPIHDFRVQDPENVVAVVVFVAVAVFVGRLTAKARAAAALADRRAKANEHLYGFAGRLAGVSDLDDLLHVTARQISNSIAVDAVVLLLEQQVLTLRAAVPPLEDLSSEDFAKAQDALTGASASIMNPPGGYLFLPMRSAGGSVGVIGVRRDRSAANLSEEERRLTEAMADQAATAIERLTLNADVERARITAETESLRSAMLSAISHDLKTPLAAILGAATSLGSYNSYFEQQGRNELVATIREEAERMSRFVVNLLDITRVELGTLEVRNEATDIGEVIGAAARRARQIFSVTTDFCCGSRPTCPSSISTASSLNRRCSICSITPPSIRHRCQQSPSRPGGPELRSSFASWTRAREFRRRTCSGSSRSSIARRPVESSGREPVLGSPSAAASSR